MRTVHGIAVCAAVLSLAPALRGVEWSEERRREVVRAIDAAQARGFRGAVALRVGDAPPVSVVAGSADRDGQVAASPSTRFQIASMSKSFAAAAVLELVERGRIRLDDPVGRHLPSLPEPLAAVRVDELLSHTSGLGNAYAAEGIGERGAAIAAIAKVPIDPEEHGRFRYSNDGYDLLAALVEEVSGEPYERFVRAHLLAPAGVRDIGWGHEVDLLDPTVVSLGTEDPPPPLRRRNYAMLGSGGMVATADALADWELALWSDRVLPAPLRQELFRERATASIGGVGLGYFLVHDPPPRGLRVTTRGSEDWGVNGVLSHWPEAGVVLVVLTSSGPPESSGDPGWSRQLTETLSEIVFGAR